MGGIVGASTCTEPRLLRAPITRKMHANYLPNKAGDPKQGVSTYVHNTWTLRESSSY